MIPREKENEIIQATDIVDLVSGYISLEKVGSNYRGLCPFHDDHNPSFSVSPSKKIAKCMSCHAGGNPITFLSSIEHISRDEACKRLANKYNVSFDYNITKTELPKYYRYLPMMDFALEFYQFCLENTKLGQSAMEYLKTRKIDEEIINVFKIGFAPNQNDVLYKTLKDKEFIEVDMLEAGLVKKYEDHYQDIFYNRILFPIIDVDGAILGFSGRIFNESNQPKYINSPDSIIFNKGKILYNLNNALPDIRKKQRVIIYEGFMDVISSYQAGIKEAVCAMGTAISKEHLLLLKKFTDNFILVLDGDDAGLNAMLRTVQLFDQLKFDVKLVIIPDKLDPDDYLKQYGSYKFRDLIENHQLDKFAFLYYFYQSDKDFSNPMDVERFKQDFFPKLKGSNTLVEMYLQKMSIDLNVSYKSLVLDYNQKHGQIKDPIIKTVIQTNEVINGVLIADKILLCHMLKNKRRCYEIIMKLDEISQIPKQYLDLSFSSIINLIYEKYKIAFDDYYFNRDSLIEYLKNCYNQSIEDEIDFKIGLPNEFLTTYMMCQEVVLSYTKKEQTDCLKRIEKFIYEYIIDKLDNNSLKIECYQEIEKLKKR